MLFNNQSFKTGNQIKSTNSKIKNIISNGKEKIKFIFYDLTSSEYLKNLILSLSPNLLDTIEKQNSIYTIRAPYGITKEDLEDFLYIYSNISFKNCPKIIGNDIKKLFALLKLMDFFGNEKFNIQIITKIIIPELTSEISVELIIYSYDKLCYFSEIKKEADNAYFELFYQSLEELSENESMIIQNIDKLKTLDGKIIEVLIQKTFRKLIFGNYLIEKNEDIINYEINENTEENYFDENDIGSSDFYQWQRMGNKKYDNNKKINIKSLKHLISLLIQKNNLDNIFSLLTREYMYLLSSESINELLNLPNPNFQTKIPISLDENYYDEFPLDININNQLLTLIIYYKKSDKSINVCVKLSKNKKEKKKVIETDDNNNCCYFEVLTFLTSVKLLKGNDSNKVISVQNNLTSLTNSKSMYSILKIPYINFGNLFNNEDNNKEKTYDFLLLTLRISLCDIYSVISSYLLHDFDKYVNDKNISKLTKQLFILLLKNPKLNKKSENNVVKCILLWLDDEINIKEDISEIFYLIKWEEVDDELIIELLIKYSHIILNDASLVNLFLEIYINKFRKNSDVELIIKKFFKAIKKLEYHQLFGKIKKDEKIMENYITKNKNHGKNNKDKEKHDKRKITYNDKCTQTEYFFENNEKVENKSLLNQYVKDEKIDDKKNKIISKQKCIWNISKIKKSFIEQCNSQNKIIRKNTKNKSKENFREKIYLNEMKNQSGKNRINSSDKEKKLTNSEKIENYKFNSSIQTSNININTRKNSENKNKKNLIKNNISVIKKPKSNSKIKEMEIFPVNFSSMKRYKKDNKNNKTNSNRKKENKSYQKFNTSTNKNNQYEKRKYHSERTSEKNKGKKYISRIYKEKKVKISYGIVKEICFMDNT